MGESEASASKVVSQVDRYVIESGVSRLTIRVTAGGLLSVLGHNPMFVISNLSGEVVYDAATPEASSLRIEMPASSLQLQSDVSEKDKREIMRATLEEVLETSKYPGIRYETRAVRPRGGNGGPVELQLEGELTLHGESRPQTVNARIVVMGEMLRANGDFVVRQTSHGIRPVAVGGKMLQVKDELNCTFDVVSRRRG